LFECGLIAAAPIDQQPRDLRRAWTVDWLKGLGLSAALGALFGGVFLWIVVATGAQWWWVFGLFATLIGLLLVFVTPYVLVPLFFKMRPLADAATVERIHALVNRAGAPVRDVCSLDFSRRTAEANAAVIGLGQSRRVVTTRSTGSCASSSPRRTAAA